MNLAAVAGADGGGGGGETWVEAVDGVLETEVEENAGVAATAPRRPYSPAKLTAIGSVSGVMGGAIAMNGPLIADYLNKSGCRPEEYLVTLNVIFVASAVTRVAMYGAGGMVTSSTLWLALATWPAAMLGVMLGGRLARMIPRAAFTRVVDGLLVLIGIYMLIQACSGRKPTPADPPTGSNAPALRSTSAPGADNRSTPVHADRRSASAHSHTF